MYMCQTIILQYGCMMFPVPALWEDNIRRQKSMCFKRPPHPQTLSLLCQKNNIISVSFSLLCPRFTGQNQWSAAPFLVLTFLRCFALTVYGGMWVWSGWDMGLIHLHTFPSWFGIYKRKLRTRRCSPGCTNLDIFVNCLICTYTNT